MKTALFFYDIPYSGSKSKQGAGHVWVLADEGLSPLQPGEPIKLITNEDEASEAVRNILNRTEADQQRQQAKANSKQQAKNLGGRTIQQAHQDHAALQRTAEQILAGIKRPTAVETVLSSSSTNGVKRPAPLVNLKGKKILYNLKIYSVYKLLA